MLAGVDGQEGDVFDQQGDRPAVVVVEVGLQGGSEGRPDSGVVAEAALGDAVVVLPDGDDPQVADDLGQPHRLARCASAARG